MASKRFELHAGDLEPRFEVRLRDDWDGAQIPVNLNTITSGTFRMKNAATGVTKVNQPVTFGTGSDALDGLVYYQWAGTDTDTAATFEAVVVLVKSGKPLTYPSTGFWIVEIHPQIS